MTMYRIYDYEPEDLCRIQSEIYRLIIENNIQNISVKKSYYKGFHLGVMTANAVTVIDDYVSRLNIRKEPKIDYQRVEQQIELISKTEESQWQNTPVLVHGTIIKSFDQVLYPGRQVMSQRDIQHIEELETQFLSQIFERWNELSIEEQNIKIRNLWILFASQHRLGVTAGYLAFKSNIEYFKDEIKDLSQSKKEYLVQKLKLSSNEELLGRGSIEEILSFADDFQIYGLEFIKKVKCVVHGALNEGRVKLNEMYYPDDFFERHKHWSEFHNEFYHETKFTENYHNKEFLTYRLTIGILYSILPELSISNLRKEKISGMVADKVECESNTSWREVLNNAISPG